MGKGFEELTPSPNSECVTEKTSDSVMIEAVSEIPCGIRMAGRDCVSVACPVKLLIVVGVRDAG